MPASVSAALEHSPELAISAASHPIHAFERETGNQVEVMYGSTGRCAKPFGAMAPADVSASASVACAKRLAELRPVLEQARATDPLTDRLLRVVGSTAIEIETPATPVRTPEA
jgi:hypothetical protein